MCSYSEHRAQRRPTIDEIKAVSEALVTKYPQFKDTDCDSGTLPVCISTIL